MEVRQGVVAVFQHILSAHHDFAPELRVLAPDNRLGARGLMKSLLCANVALPAVALDDAARALVEVIGSDDAELSHGPAVLASGQAQRALVPEVVLHVLARQELLGRAPVRAAEQVERAAERVFLVFLQLPLPRAPAPSILAYYLQGANNRVSYATE